MNKEDERTLGEPAQRLSAMPKAVRCRHEGHINSSITSVTNISHKAIGVGNMFQKRNEWTQLAQNPSGEYLNGGFDACLP